MEAVFNDVMHVIPGERHEINICDTSGETKLIWDPSKPEEVDNAEKTFDRFKKKGYLIYRTDKDGGKGELMHKFDSTAARIIISEPLRGG